MEHRKLQLETHWTASLQHVLLSCSHIESFPCLPREECTPNASTDWLHPSLSGHSMRLCLGNKAFMFCHLHKNCQRTFQRESPWCTQLHVEQENLTYEPVFLHSSSPWILMKCSYNAEEQYLDDPSRNRHGTSFMVPAPGRQFWNNTCISVGCAIFLSCR